MGNSKVTWFDSATVKAHIIDCVIGLLKYLDVIKQVKRLNAFVLEYSVSNILSNIEMHKVYKKNVSKLPKPMDLPKYISSAGTRTNPNYFY